VPEVVQADRAQPGVVAEVQAHGFEPGFGHISTAAESDRHEWSWTGALAAWAVDEGRADRDAALDLARTHRREWLDGYRGQLGFRTVVLHDLRTAGG